MNLPSDRKLCGKSRKRLALLSFLALATCCLGCNNSGYYPVHGKVVNEAGQPISGLEGSQIEFSSQDGGTSSVGEIQADGSFELTTETPGDGAPPGEYKVLIAPKSTDPENPIPRVIHQKYESFDSSGLTSKVEEKTNTPEFKVQAVGPAAR